MVFSYALCISAIGHVGPIEIHGGPALSHGPDVLSCTGLNLSYISSIKLSDSKYVISLDDHYGKFGPL